jgi:hypothetical protein
MIHAGFGSTMAMYKISSFGDPLRSSRHSGLDMSPPVSAALEDTGIAFSLGVLRIGYFYGGDGERSHVDWAVPPVMSIQQQPADAFAVTSSVHYRGASLPVSLCTLQVKASSRSMGAI